MNKKIIVAIVGLCFVGMLGFSTSNKVSAEESSYKDWNIDETDPRKVFPKEEVDRLVEEANSQPIISDPDTGGLTRSSGNNYPTRKGVILVTADAWKGVVPTGHAAIIYSSDKVVESNSGGVEVGKNNWSTAKETAYGVDVNNTSSGQESSAANYCYNKVGLPYNWNFYRMDYRDKFYCSHLVRSAFLDLYGVDLNTSEFDSPNGGLKAIHPMELVTTTKTSTIYRK